MDNYHDDKERGSMPWHSEKLSLYILVEDLSNCIPSPFHSLKNTNIILMVTHTGDGTNSIPSHGRVQTQTHIDIHTKHIKRNYK